MTRAERAALIAAGAGLLGCVVGTAVSGADAFFQSYLVGVVFWVEIAFGCLGILLLHGLTGGGWGLAARRPLHVAPSTLPLLRTCSKRLSRPRGARSRPERPFGRSTPSREVPATGLMALASRQR